MAQVATDKVIHWGAVLRPRESLAMGNYGSGLAPVLVLWLLVFLTSGLASLPAFADGGETSVQSMEFRWKFIKVGAMDFEIGSAFFSRPASAAGEHGRPLFQRQETKQAPTGGLNESAGAPVHLAVTGVTQGPLRWFKNYQARAELTVNDKRRTFVLAGKDGGVNEERALVFSQGFAPRVDIFVDSSALEPFEVQESWRTNTVDPLTVFEWIIYSAVQGRSCGKKFWVYDGKRRYAARTTTLVREDAAEGEDLGVIQNSTISCRLTLIGSGAKGEAGAKVARAGVEVAESGDGLAIKVPVDDESVLSEKGGPSVKRGWKSLWPFGTSDRHIDFEFKICSHNRIIVERVVMSAPIGKIVGRNIVAC